MFEFRKRTRPLKNKFVKWKEWAARKLRAKNVLINLGICAYGKKHLVKAVKPFGGHYVFWSEACSGCSLGMSLINLNQAVNAKPLDLHCALLKSGLLIEKEVKVGSVVDLPERD